MNLSSGGSRLRTVVVLCLAALYFMLATGVTLLGSGIYRAVVAEADGNAAHRTALSYVTNQLRGGSAGTVGVGTFGGSPALRLTETIPDGSVYLTLIYCYEGQLRELYTEEATRLTPADGIAIIPLASLDFSLRQNLVTITAGDGVRLFSVTLAPRTGVEEVGAL